MTAYSVLGPLQAAIYARLSGDAGFMALVKGVLDYVPETQPFPYVSIGEATELPWDTFGGGGSEATITLHTWSRANGYKEAQALNAAQIGLLDNQTGLAIAGYGLVLLNFESATAVRDPDGITRHIATRYRVLADAT